MQLAAKANWDEELQLFYLGHFLAQQKAKDNKTMDPEHFNSSAVAFAKAAGWSLQVPILTTCEMIDLAGQKADFAAWIDDAAVTWLAEMNIQPPATPERLLSTEDHIHHYESAAKLDEALRFLRMEEDLSQSVDAGSAIMSWEFEFPIGYKARIEVAQGEPPYVDAYLVHLKDGQLHVLTSLRPSSVLEQTFEFHYDGTVYKVTIHRA